jgi:hypothetical protein
MSKIKNIRDCPSCVAIEEEKSGQVFLRCQLPAAHQGPHIHDGQATSSERRFQDNSSDWKRPYFRLTWSDQELVKR